MRSCCLGCGRARAGGGVGGLGGYEGGALRGDFISHEGEGVGDFPTLQLGHECGRIWEAAGGMVVEEFIEGSAEFTAVETG